MRPSPQRRNPLDQLLALDQSGNNDLQQLGSLQSLQANQMMMPQQLQQGDLQNQLLKEQVNSAPDITKARIQGEKMKGIGELGTGMSYTNPQLSGDVMQQLLQSEGLYHPDPEAGLKAKAAQMGMSVDQLKQMITQLQQHHH